MDFVVDGRGYQLPFAIFLADEKAIKEILAVKGAGSYKPCCKCMAILGRILAADVRPPFQHYTCQCPALFDEYTYEGFLRACETVRGAWAESAIRGREMETLLGISWLEGRALPFSDRAPLYRIPESVYWDAQHSVWASGGIAQYECNQFIQHVIGFGIIPDALQTFLRQVHLPKASGSPHIRCDVMRRLARGDGAHIRGFASELLCLVPCLVAFADMVLTPIEALTPHATCLRLLYTFQTIIMQGDRARDVVRLLDEIIDAHHELYLLLYPSCGKPKLHYVRHLPRLIAKFGCVLTCFGPERHHRRSKRIAAHAFRNMVHTLISRSSSKVLCELQDPKHFTPVTLGGPKRGYNWTKLLQELGYVSQRQSNTLRSRQWFHKDDLVLFNEATTRCSWSAGFAAEFHEATKGGNTAHVAVIRVLTLVSPQENPCSWLYSTLTPSVTVVVTHDKLLRAVPWVRDGPRIRAILPMYARDLIN